MNSFARHSLVLGLLLLVMLASVFNSCGAAPTNQPVMFNTTSGGIMLPTNLGAIFIPGTNISIRTTNLGTGWAIIINSSASGGGLTNQFNTTQFATNAPTINIKDGANVTNLNVGTALTGINDHLDVFQGDHSGYCRFGFDGGSAGNFQFFGDTSGNPGLSLFVGGIGDTIIYYNATASALRLPPASDAIDFTGQDLAGTPSSTIAPVAWWKVQMDAVTYYIPLYQ